MKIDDFLKIKNRVPITVKPNETISVVIQKLVENSIGALPVCNDDGILLGIISERDLLKEVYRDAAGIDTTEVQSVMTKDVVVGTPNDTLDYAASVMRQQKVRHLPIITGKKLYGILSMRDIINQQLMDAEAELRHLRSW